MESYYVDSCIYLNLWQKEVAFDGFKFWKVAKYFFEKAEKNGKTIYYSGYILKEISYVLDKNEFDKMLALFNKSANLIRINLSIEEYEFARRIESEINKFVGFFDVIHMLLAKKTNSVLITRDRNLIEIARKYGVKVARPEELL